MFRKIALGLFLLIALVSIALFAVASTRPDSYHVERSAVLAAPPATVHAMIENMHRFNDWSPWQKYDPTVKTDYAGPATGVGASQHWVGSGEMGEGRMTITESRPNELIRIKLEFFKPFAATNTAEITFKPEGNQTAVTWSMASGPGTVRYCFVARE